MKAKNKDPFKKQGQKTLFHELTMKASAELSYVQCILWNRKVLRKIIISYLVLQYKKINKLNIIKFFKILYIFIFFFWFLKQIKRV